MSFSDTRGDGRKGTGVGREKELNLIRGNWCRVFVAVCPSYHHSPTSAENIHWTLSFL